MIRRSLRIGALLGLLGGAAVALAKLLTGDHEPPLSLASQPPEPWTPLSTDPDPPPQPAAKVWVEPKDGVCPTSHPVKAKLSSKIFHLPGMTNYERTNPDRCYADAATAESDGLRVAKR